MLNRYCVTRYYGDRVQRESVMSAIDLARDTIILACGFDPYGTDTFEIYNDLTDTDDYLNNGGSVSDIIIDASKVIDIMKSNQEV